MKKYLSLLLAFVLCLTSLAGTVHAALAENVNENEAEETEPLTAPEEEKKVLYPDELRVGHPTITKGYCMFVAQGRVEDIPYTDNVTIEETNVTPELVHRLHGEGVKVFCWTVDLQDTVQYLVSCDVDVIGTDNPLLINAALDHVDYSGGLPRFFYIIMNVITDMAR